MAKIDGFFRLMVSEGGSDLHMATGNKPRIRVSGELREIEYHELSQDELQTLLYEICPEEKQKLFEETGDLDFAYEIPGVARFRCNYFMQKSGVTGVFRQIPSEILTAEQLSLPPICLRFAMLNKGMVLVTGPTGSGKSTTLAAILDYANKNRTDHILTLEDPIEFVHQSRSCLVNHREIGTHSKSFSTALRGALREDPDIILVGEMRDLETIELAIEAAATGHLVFGTLHTMSAMKTVDRIVEVFPANQQERIRVTLADVLKGVIAQNLFKRVDKPGRCAALEILVVNNAASAVIRQNKTHQLLSVMQTSTKSGMQTLDDAIQKLLDKGYISIEEAFEKCINKERFAPLLKEPPDELAMG
ncbi:Type IV pilus twitching motility protein PilT [Sulfidibacter corallicola]|uniref:Type IV pilus twitching motility protein PilT n=1 Tax=Sulfidibacter corallicola TaxID=2818388 RepID=A0A8A4TU71_SULCO|nr:type IV pilus twitching motility protein PilT [Sulfidibacter corallicola]QTD52917.1 type IV pilus twitching motility protein PilT [Sulfidibacter corallicola]